MSGDAGGGDLHRILSGLALAESDDDVAPRGVPGGRHRDFFGGSLF
jgi:hypothetical protein